MRRGAGASPTQCPVPSLCRVSGLAISYGATVPADPQAFHPRYESETVPLSNPSDQKWTIRRREIVTIPKHWWSLSAERAGGGSLKPGFGLSGDIQSPSILSSRPKQIIAKAMICGVEGLLF